MKQATKQLFIISIFSLLALVSTANIEAATYTVTNTNDNGAGSLRDAITIANSTIDDDTINFAIPANDANCTADGVCSIILINGEFAIYDVSPAGRLTITNSRGASNLVISGNNVNRIFFANSGASFTLNGVTITNGNGTGTTNSTYNGLGGGICVEASNKAAQLTVTNSIVINNTAQKVGGGISNTSTFGTTTVTNSIVINNTAVTDAGGILSGGTMRVTNSSVSNNVSQGYSGGIRNYGTVIVTNSTVSGNTAQVYGGGIYSNNIGVIIVTNSTVSGNTATDGGGIYDLNGTLTVTNSTISNNTATRQGGGIYNNNSSDSVAYIRNSIVASNNAANGQLDIYHGTTDKFTSRGNNLVGNSTDTNISIAWQASDILNQSPRLAPLKNYGGATQTQKLLLGSPAINAGNNCVLTANGCGDGNPAITTDQRGFGRNGQVDIGAFELQAGEAFGGTQFDFDGDRRADISVTRANGSSLNWYLNNSQTGFTGVGFGNATDVPAPADYDGDGKTDIAVFRDGNWYILQSQTNSFRAVQFGQTGDVALPADYDGDGKADVAVFRAGNWYILQSQTNSFKGLQFGVSTDKPVPADYDGDGKADVAVTRVNSDSLSWYVQGSTAGFTSTNFGIPTDKAVVADYNGDGKADIAVFRNDSWYVLRSRDGFTGVQFGSSGDVPVAADYDGDGRADFAVTRTTNGSMTWYLLRSTTGFTGVQFGVSADKQVENIYVP